MSEKAGIMRGTSRAVAVGVLCGIATQAALNHFGTIEGRKGAVYSCPDGYRGIVEVTNPGVLPSLAFIAIDESITDSFAHAYGPGTPDIASSDSELACIEVAPPNNVDLPSPLVLLPSGLEAMQHSSDFNDENGQLPNGLKWTFDN